MTGASRIIGVDESGKGDFFGPLVIASFLAAESDLAALKAIGVRDGKLISDRRIIEIDQALRSHFPHAVIVISPPEYNRVYDELKNLNKLLGEGHARAIDELLCGHEADLAISDKFGKSERIQDALSARGRTIELKQIVRGESILQVAAASILARARYLSEMEALSEEFAVDLPRGAAARVDEAGRHFVAIHGVESLSNVAKLHFKNYHRVVNPRLL